LSGSSHGRGGAARRTLLRGNCPQQCGANHKKALSTPLRPIANTNHYNDKNINYKMKTTLFFAIALALFALVALAAADEKTASNGDVAVNVQGTSGKITFWIPERSDKKYTLTFDSLCETGGGDCLNTFANQEFTFSTPATVSFNNISSKLVSFDSTIATGSQSGVKLTADLYVFLESGNYTVGDQTFYAVENAFKWSVNVSGWVFANAANKLELTMGLQHPSYKASWDATNYTLSYTNVHLHFNQFCLLLLLLRLSL
jgi:hypothetical protein